MSLAHALGIPHLRRMDGDDARRRAGAESTATDETSLLERSNHVTTVCLTPCCFNGNWPMPTRSSCLPAAPSGACSSPASCRASEVESSSMLALIMRSVFTALVVIAVAVSQC
eukprot:6193415-Pleurochrysis_carterae.AAC.5